MKACPACGARNEERSQFCNDCGQRLPAAGGEAPAVPPPAAGDPRTSTMHGNPLCLGPVVPSNPTPIAPPSLPATSATCAQCGYKFPGGIAVSWCPGCGTLLDGAVTTSSMTTSNIPSAAPVVAPTADLKPGPPPAGWALVLLKAGERLDRWTLRLPETWLGRTEGEILFREDALLSPRHAKVFWRSGALWIEDGGSQNGVYIRLREAARLQPGDFLNLGSLVVRYDPSGGGPRSTSLLPPAGGVKPFGTGRERSRGSLVRILQDGSDGPAYPLTPSRTIVGRKVGHYLFPDDPLLSRQHAQFYERDGEMWVEDLGSSNGTLARIRGATVIEKGAVLRLGDVTLEVAGP